MAVRRRDQPHTAPRSKYIGPPDVKSMGLRDALQRSGRAGLTAHQLEFFRGAADDQPEDVELYYAGNLELLDRPCVSIVGTREATFEGQSRAARLAKELSVAGIVVMSGLARGIDGAAHRNAIQHGGRTVAVIGTPIDKSYPAEHSDLQTEIWRNHLLISPFRSGVTVYPSNFPRRNRVMAALSDATAIIEAAEGSGTLHQAAECQRLKRWLFISQTVVNDSRLEWPKRFIGHPFVETLTSTSDIVSKLDAKRNGH